MTFLNGKFLANFEKTEKVQDRHFIIKLDWILLEYERHSTKHI